MTCRMCGGSGRVCSCATPWSSNPNHNAHCLTRRRCPACANNPTIHHMCTRDRYPVVLDGPGVLLGSRRVRRWTP